VPFNGVGMFVRLRNWVADAAAGVKIRADYHDIEDDGFADGLSHCITRDGQTVVLQNIPMNSKRVTALSDPVDLQDAATKAYADLKLPLAGGTITGSLTVNGQITTTAYKCRAGLSGAYGANWFNFNWTAGGMEVWADDYKWGIVATQAYVEQRASDWAHTVADPKVNRAGDTMTGGLTLPHAFATSNVYYFSTGAGYLQWQGGGTYVFGSGGTAWHTGNLNPIQDGRLVNAGSPAVPANDQVYEPFAGAVISGLIRSAGVQGLPVYGARWRYLQLLTPGGWYTVAYA
jgi:hypothetical protein